MLCLTLPQLGFADMRAKPNLWMCNVKEDLPPWPKLDQVSISLNEPTLMLTNYTRNADGSYRSKIVPLITAEKVTIWGVNRADCTVTGGLIEGEATDAYLLNFRCADRAQASLFVDFKSGTGNFSEELIKLRASRYTTFQDCYAQ